MNSYDNHLSEKEQMLDSNASNLSCLITEIHVQLKYKRFKALGCM